MTRKTGMMWSELVRRAGSSDELHDAWLARGDRSSRIYIGGVVRNLRRLRARTERRRREREALWVQQHPHAQPDPLQALERTELAMAMRAALDQLDEATRALVCARYVDGHRAKDLARECNRSANTVRWQLRDAIRQQSMQPNEELQHLLAAVEDRLDALGDGWSGRLVVHLRPTPAQTLVDTVELIPTPPRGIRLRARRALQSPPLPGCTLPPFEMHFDISP